MNVRLQEMYYIIQNALSTWSNPAFVELKDNVTKNSVYRFENVWDVEEKLDRICIFPAIAKETGKLYAMSKYFHTNKKPVLLPNEREAVDVSMRQIKHDLQTMLEMCEMLGVEPRSQGIDVKLPDNITLDELSKCSKDLNLFFEQCPLLRSDSEQIRFHGVDVGSAWLTFTVIGISAAHIIKKVAEIADKVIMICSHKADYDRQIEEAKKLNVSKNTLEVMANGYGEVFEKLKEKAVAELANENNLDAPEDQERLSYSLNLLSGWLEKGMQIFPSIGTPQDVKAVFPVAGDQGSFPIEPQKLSRSAEDTNER